MEAEPKMLIFNVTGAYDGSCVEHEEEIARTDPNEQESVTLLELADPGVAER